MPRLVCRALIGCSGAVTSFSSNEAVRTVRMTRARAAPLSICLDPATPAGRRHIGCVDLTAVKPPSLFVGVSERRSSVCYTRRATPENATLSPTDDASGHDALNRPNLRLDRIIFIDSTSNVSGPIPRRLALRCEDTALGFPPPFPPSWRMAPLS